MDDVTKPRRNVTVGAAAVDLGGNDLPLVGMMEPVPATGEDGVLRAVATVIQGPPNDTRVAIVALDVIAMGREYLDVAAREIEKESGIPFDHIVVNCTHTHHAPSTVRAHGFDVNRPFALHVKNAIVQAVIQANQKLSSSPDMQARFIMGREATVGQNSRVELREGAISWTLHSPQDEQRPTGPFDPDFPVLAFKRPDRSLAAVIFGHSTHNIGTRTSGHRSPAFYGLAAQSFERESGAVTTFIEGAHGSTHLLEFDGFRIADVASADRISAEAERRVLNAIRYHVEQAPPLVVQRVGSLKRELTVKVREFDEPSEEKAVSAYCSQAFAGEYGTKCAAIFRRMRAELAPHRGEERKTWISATRIGDVAMVGIPAELFAQLGVDIKVRSPFRHTFIADLANDWVGYVGNADAYRLGGYQMWMGHHSWTERGTGELIVNEAVELLNELYAQ